MNDAGAANLTLHTTAVLRDAAARLSAAGLPSPQADARALLEFVLGIDAGQLAITPRISEEQADRFNALVEQRAENIPVQHLTGQAWFRYTSLRVGPGVFIPRPETEGLVQIGLDWLKTLPTGRIPLVVDLGTGSGAIAKSVAQEFQPSRVYAVEKSPQAFEFATQNLSGTGVELRAGDLADAFEDLNGRVDLVLSNPPYVPSTAASQLPEDVAHHDPSLALYAGPDGLDVIRVVAEVAKRLLRPGGLVVVEHDDSQGESAPEVFLNAGFQNVADLNDLTGRPRYTQATLTS
jgi:release factor glutamine methyltransferase